MRRGGNPNWSRSARRNCRKWQYLRAEVFAGGDEFFAMQSMRRNGRELSRIALLLTGLAFAAEIYLEQRFSRGQP